MIDGIIPVTGPYFSQKSQKDIKLSSTVKLAEDIPWKIPMKSHQESSIDP